MNASLPRTEKVAIAAAVASLALGIGLLLVVRKALDLDEDATVVALLLLPLIVYLAASGRLAEFKAGPIGAKLRDLARQPVGAKADFEPVANEDVAPLVQKIETIAKGGRSALDRRLEVLDRERPPVLYLELGRKYDREDLIHYIDTLAQLRRFKFVVIVARGTRRIHCYAPHYTLKHLLGLPVRGEAFLRLIEEAREQELKEYPGMRSTFLAPTSTKKDALEKMIDQGLESLLVLDAPGGLVGIVERDEVMARLLIAMTS